MSIHVMHYILNFLYIERERELSYDTMHNTDRLCAMDHLFVLKAQMTDQSSSKIIFI
jgi:hypothetical protein